jgi:hypothetical protein
MMYHGKALTRQQMMHESLGQHGKFCAFPKTDSSRPEPSSARLTRPRHPFRPHELIKFLGRNQPEANCLFS